MQPLSDILVLDFTTLLPGPLATLMLAEAGAEVIKIERPGGEDMRAYSRGSTARARSSRCSTAARQSLVLDLKSEADRDKLKPLIERADVLVEQFRPGVMARLGLGYDAVQAINRAHLLLDHRLRPDRAARRRGRPRPQLHRRDRTAGAHSRAGGPPGGAAGAGRRHRRRHHAGGDQHPAGAAPARPERRGLPSRHRHDGRDVHLRLARAGGGPGDRRVSRPGGARLTGGSPRYQLYPTRDGKLVACARAGGEILAGVHGRDRACAGVDRRQPRSGGDQGRGRRDHRRQDRRGMAAGVRRGRLLRHHRGVARGGDARSAFRRARVVRAQGRGAERRHHAGAAGADRSGSSATIRRCAKAAPKLSDE